MRLHDRRSFLRRTAGVVVAVGVGSTAATARGAADRIDTEVPVRVGADGELVFAPELTRISVGTTVRFVWESDNHNVVVDSEPGGADWNGTPDGAGTVYDAGYEYTHTFETPGRYEFHCEPHESAGMTGAIEVYEPDVTVTVGPGGELAYDPETLEVDRGTIVRWLWEGDNHNIAVESHPDDAAFAGTPGDEFYDAGYEFVYPFDTAGTYEYYCTPHRAAGMEGTVLVGDAATTTPSPRSGTVTVVVGPGNELAFEPADITIERGTTVRWVWEGDNHNVVVDSQPDGADWQGTPGGEEEFYNAGYEYSHTFETVGIYDYYCTPHQSAGEVGSIEVVEAGTTTTPETTSSAGTTTDDDGTTTDAADSATDADAESVPFRGPAVVGTGALAAGALARLRRRLTDDGE